MNEILRTDDFDHALYLHCDRVSHDAYDTLLRRHDAALRAENARLRAAIVEYASAAGQFVGPTNSRYADARSALLRIAGGDPRGAGRVRCGGGAVSAGTICPVCEMDKCRCRRKAVTAKKARTLDAWAWAEWIARENRWFMQYRYDEDTAKREREFSIKCDFIVGPLTLVEIPLPKPRRPR